MVINMIISNDSSDNTMMVVVVVRYQGASMMINWNGDVYNYIKWCQWRYDDDDGGRRQRRWFFRCNDVNFDNNHDFDDDNGLFITQLTQRYVDTYCKLTRGCVSWIFKLHVGQYLLVWRYFTIQLLQTTINQW